MRIIKKAFSLFASAVGVLIISSFLNLQPISQSPAMAFLEGFNDITMVKNITDPVGSGDSGSLNFNYPADENYQARTENVAQPGKDRTVQGWVWNTNLGYISMYCEGGSNSGASCGSEQYKTVVKTKVNGSGNITEAKLMGWAWGDSTGWINMGCENGKNTATNTSCGNVDYGVHILRSPSEATGSCKRADGSALQTGDLYGYAWTSSVGWINFCGAHADLGGGELPPTEPILSLGLIPFEIVENPTQKPDQQQPPDQQPPDQQPPDQQPDPNQPENPPGEGEGAASSSSGGSSLPPELIRLLASGETGGNKVYANGSDSYKILIPIYQNGVPVSSIPAGHAAEVSNIKFTSTLRADQVTLCKEVNGKKYDRTPCTYNGAILPNAASFVWDSALKGLVAEVKAIAPTNNETNDRITLNALTIKIDNVLYPISDIERNFIFWPAVQVAAFPEEIRLTREASEPFWIQAIKHPGAALPEDSSINIYSQLHDCSDIYDFVFDQGEIGNVWNPDTKELSQQTTRMSRTTNTMSATELSLDREIELQQPCAKPDRNGNIDVDSTPLSTFLGGNTTQKNSGIITRPIFTFVPAGPIPTETVVTKAAGYRGRVEYKAPQSFAGAPGTQVRYFAATVPDSPVSNQAADIKGNVRLDTQEELQKGRVEKSFAGGFAQSKRKIYVNAISNLLRGKKIAAPAGAANGILKVDKDISDLNIKFLYLTRESTGVTQNDKPCKIIFDDNQGDDGQISFKNDLTIISKGCDIFINQNIWNNPKQTTPNKGRLGIIALEDLNMQGKRKGGNVYICHRVTDVEANIVSDGAVFSYGESEAVCGNPDDNEIIDQTDGVPQFTMNLYNAAHRQLTIVGSIISNNTAGGAFASPPVLGSGKVVEDPADLIKARMYDINFLRYSSTQEDGFGTTCWAPGIVLSKRFDDKRTSFKDYDDYRNMPGTPNLRSDLCQGVNADTSGIVNIIYRAPSSGMAVFNAVK